MRLGAVIKKWRIMSEFSQRTLAQKIGISTAALCRVENGKNCDSHTLFAILKWLWEEK